jgi:hypothetical protein
MTNPATCSCKPRHPLVSSQPRTPLLNRVGTQSLWHTGRLNQTSHGIPAQPICLCCSAHSLAFINPLSTQSRRQERRPLAPRSGTSAWGTVVLATKCASSATHPSLTYLPGPPCSLCHGALTQSTGLWNSLHSLINSHNTCVKRQEATPTHPYPT